MREELLLLLLQAKLQRMVCSKEKEM